MAMKGVWNRIVRVDLSTRKITKEEVPDKVFENFIGGGGLGSYYLYKEVPAHVKGFDPENRLIFSTGPFQGNAQSGAAKWTVISKSPAMNMNAISAATASFGYELKVAGYDALIMQGKADKPVYIYVRDDVVEIRDASDLWGKDAYETEDILTDQLGKEFEVAAIGQAAERLSLISCIGTQKHSFAGRGGMGAVMGSKNLKAVVVHGTKTVEYADPAKLKEINKAVARKLNDNAAAREPHMNIKTHGTAIVSLPFFSLGNAPVKNWQLGLFESGLEAMKTPTFTETLNAKPWPCKFCVMACHRRIDIPDGPYQMEGAGPEYENYAMLGFDLLIDDLKAVAYANDLCNRYCLDTISLGGALAWAFECYEKGILTKEHTYGIELKWGSGEALVEMTKKIGMREEGLGWLLGEGVKIASEKIGKGSQEWAVQIKGLEIPAHDPRAAFVAGLNYCTSASSGPHHERGNPQHIFVAGVRLPEFGVADPIEEKERWSWDKAPERTMAFQDYAEIVNSLVHCKFMVFDGFTLTDLLDSWNASTGLNWSMDQFRKAGERIFNLNKLLNLRYGKTKADDLAFPKRLMEPKPDGAAAGVVPEGIENAIDEYYKKRGWDNEGVPTKEKLADLGLDRLLET
jgi:aldehyde:ferredoxin oxidoreductase